ncbi:MAG: M43 family zinc metalloprotease [Chitinophagales bacterium]
MYKSISISLLLIISLYACSSSKKISNVFITGKEVIVGSKVGENTLPTSPKRKICNEYLNYAPDLGHLNHTPMRWIRINIHFVNNLAGNVNFSEDEGRQFAKDIVEISNEKLLKNAKMNLPIDNNTPILPAQYQYILSGIEGDETDDGIYFHQDDELFESNKKGGKHSNYSKEQYKQFGIRKEEVINIFFLEHHPDSIKSPTYKASGDGIGFPTWVKVIGAYMVHHDNPKMSIRAVADNFSGVFNHEIGHSLGLAHTWQTNDGCDDTPLNANCWNIDRNKTLCDDMNKVSNNMMDYNAWRSAITPCQIGKVHYKLSDENAIQRKMLVQTWCTYKPEATIRIQTGEHIIWKSAKDLEGDIVVEKDASLTLQCLLSLPQCAKISVKIGGKLLLDGATITNRCGEKWQGIEVEKQGKIRGIVEVLSPSKVEKSLKRGFIF